MKKSPKKPVSSTRIRGGPLSELGALRITDPPAWAKRVRAALAASPTRIGAAKILKISYRQMHRLLSDPLLADLR